MHDGGAKKAVIQWFYSHPYSTVADTICNNELRHDGHIPRSGAPKCYTDAEERLVLRMSNISKPDNRRLGNALGVFSPLK
jgi:hypothetical protein